MILICAHLFVGNYIPRISKECMPIKVSKKVAKVGIESEDPQISISVENDYLVTPYSMRNESVTLPTYLPYICIGIYLYARVKFRQIPTL